MAGRREEKKKKTRKAIIDAAVKLFGDKGYEQTSMATLAHAAGVGKGTIYGYFKTKSEILLAFCEEQLGFVYQELAEKTDSNADLVQQLLTVFMAEFRFVTRNKEFGRIFLREIIFPKELTLEKFHELDARYLDLIFSLITASQARGELRDDYELLFIAGHFYSLYILAVSSWYSGRVQTEEEVAEGMEHLFNQAIEGLKQRKP
ncbi:MAG: TetR/AcrR family transcriptional regulator [Thermodesulfobacteriota bacterium]